MRIFIFALILIVSLGCIYGQKSTTPKTKLMLYAYPINSFTKIPITKKSIKDAATFKKKIKNGNEFILKFESLLKNQEVLNEPTEIKTNVRIYIEVLINNKIENTIVLNKWKNVEYKGKCFNVNQEIMDLILGLFPLDKRGEYTPISVKDEE